MLKACSPSLLVILSCLSLSCGKGVNPGPIFERVDTIKYEALLGPYNNDWCVNFLVPSSYKTINGGTPILPPNIGSTFEIGECNATQNQSFEFTMDKYKNQSILLSISAYNQWANTPPYFDTTLTLNIYLNNVIVASQTSKGRDSVQYTIR